MFIYDFSDFTPAIVSKVNSQALFSHTMSRGTLPGSNKIWICKEISDPSAAARELIAQEFFRLIIPHQPETRLMQHPATQVYYILSEESIGYQPLPKNIAQRFHDLFGPTGLGQAVVCAMFLEETDLKNGNIGINSLNQIIKIDGDWCFSSLKYLNLPFNITPNAIASLPYPQDFYAFNWFDVVKQGVPQYSSSSLIDPALTVSPRFRAEANEAILMTLMVPDEFIQVFIDTYIAAGTQVFIDLLKGRRNELLSSAYQNGSFQAYLFSPKAKRDAITITKQMSSFQVNDQPLIIYGTISLNEYARIMIETLQNSNDPLIEQSAQLVKELSIQLNQLPQYRVSTKDALLLGYIRRNRTELSHHCNDVAQLLMIQQDMKQIRASIGSQTIQDAIKMLQSRWNGDLPIDKALALEKYFCTIPLNERETNVDYSEYALNLLEVIQGHDARAPNSTHETMLKICLIPNELIKHFIEAHNPNSTHYFMELLEDRRDEWIDNVVLIPAFQAYLYTPDATHVATMMIDQMKSYQTMGKPFLMPPSAEQFVPHVMSYLKNHQLSALSEASKLVRELSIQLNLLSLCEINNKDTLLHEYARYKRTLISQHCDNVDKLKQLKQDIETIHASVNSPQMQQAKKMIQSGNGRQISKETKTAIETKLCAIALRNRGEPLGIDLLNKSKTFKERLAEKTKDTNTNQDKGTDLPHNIK